MPLAQTTMSDPSPDPSGSPSGQSRNTSWASYLIIGLFCLAVLAPTVFAGFVPAEQPYWLEAEAAEARLDNNYDALLLALDKQSAIRPHLESRFQLERLRILVSAGRYAEAIAIGEELVKAHPGPWGGKDVKEQSDASSTSSAELKSGVSASEKAAPTDGEAKRGAGKQANRKAQGEKKSVELTIEDFPHYQWLTSAYQSVGEFDKALSLLLSAEKFGLSEADGNTINALAYTRALAGKGLYQAFDGMNLLVRRQFDKAALHHYSGYHHLLLLREGKREFLYAPELRDTVLELALHDFAMAAEARTLELEKEIRAMESAVTKEEDSSDAKPQSDKSEPQSEDADSPSDEQDQPNEGTESELEQQPTPQTKQEGADGNEAIEKEEDRIGQRRRELALVFAHRAMVFESVSDQANADADWDRVRELGFSPKVLSRQGFNTKAIGAQVFTMAQWLDTLGYVKFRQNRFADARAEFNRAIRFLESYLSLLRFNRVEVARQSPDVRIFTNAIRQAERSLAAVMFHNWELEQADGNQEAAALIRERIESMGFALGPHLH